MNKENLYKTDFYAWTQEQANYIKNKELYQLDVINLLEELESMGKQEKRELINRLTMLLMHLLKWKYQPDKQSRSWNLTIKEQRKQINYNLKENPSLSNQLTDSMNYAYSVAIIKASKETELDESVFSPECQWSIEEVLNNVFLPL